MIYIQEQQYGDTYYNSEKPFLLALEDPHDPDNNVGRGSYQILTVRLAFAHAFRILHSDKVDVAPTPLSRILNIDETMVKYRQYVKVKFL